MSKTQTSENLTKIAKIQQFVTKLYDLRFNTLTNELLARPKGKKDPFELFNQSELVCQLFEAGYSKFNAELEAFLSARVPRFDPIREYFNTLPTWDGQTDHIDYLAAFVETDDDAFFRPMFAKHLVRTVRQALALEPGFFNKHCLTFVGNQNDGKTRFFDFLVPTQLAEYQRKGIDFGTNDGKISISQNFQINLDELASFDRKELNNHFKTVLSESTVKFRGLYQKTEQRHARRASFVASTNQTEFLTDETGNVRWLVFNVLAIHHDNGGPRGYNRLVNMDLVWSQAYALYKGGFPDQLTPDELQTLNRRNANFMRVSHEMELLRTHFQPAGKEEPGTRFYSASKLAEELQALSRFRLNSTMVGRGLNALRYPRDKYAGTYGYWLKHTETPNQVT